MQHLAYLLESVGRDIGWSVVAPGRAYANMNFPVDLSGRGEGKTSNATGAKSQIGALLWAEPGW